MKKIQVPPDEGWLAAVLDWVMLPLMYFVSGTLSETPQRTHRWNNRKITHDEATQLASSSQCVVRVGVASPERERFLWKIPIFHMPIFGGWKNYMVFKPCGGTSTGWHIGWIAGDTCGVTTIKLKGSVRMLLGPGDVTFFGIDAMTGEQIPIKMVGRGRIGDEGPFANLPLL